MFGFSSENLILAVLHTMAYADVFDYPLTLLEIHRYLTRVPASIHSLKNLLESDKSLLAHSNGYYALPGREPIIEIRQRREQAAASLWPQAIHYALIISCLPFIRLVAITGALAMNNVEKKADIDYFIVTEPGHLWLSRAFVILLGHYAALRGMTLCPNYIITLNSLTFPDRNEYSAHEVAQMIPLAGMNVYYKIRQQNDWIGNFLPNAEGPPIPIRSLPQSPSRSLSRPTLEYILSTQPFSSLERWEMGRKIRKLRQEQKTSPESNFSPDVCKGHDQSHQTHTLAALAEKLQQMPSIS